MAFTIFLSCHTERIDISVIVPFPADNLTSRCRKRVIGRNGFTVLALIDRNICLVCDLDPALRFQPHQVSELLRRHGFGFGALV